MLKKSSPEMNSTLKVIDVSLEISSESNPQSILVIARLIVEHKNFVIFLLQAYHSYTNESERIAEEILSVKYEDGRWSKPYYDCGGGNIWMLTYTVPFFGYENGTYFFK